MVLSSSRRFQKSDLIRDVTKLICGLCKKCTAHITHPYISIRTPPLLTRLYVANPCCTLFSTSLPGVRVSQRPPFFCACLLRFGCIWMYLDGSVMLWFCVAKAKKDPGGRSWRTDARISAAVRRDEETGTRLWIRSTLIRRKDDMCRWGRFATGAARPSRSHRAPIFPPGLLGCMRGF